MRRSGITALMLFAFSLPLSAAEPSVYVFYPSTIRPYAMRNELMRLVPGVNFEVFGRYKEFESRIAEQPPDALISLEPVISSIADWRKIAQGLYKNASSERYVLLSVDTEIKDNELNDINIGVVDLLGRKPMAAFLAKKMRKDKIKIVPATKLEDLLTMLQLQEVKAILVPESQVEYYRSRSRLNLKTSMVGDLMIGHTAVAISPKDPENTKIIRDLLQKMDKKAMEMLRVDSWQNP